MWNIHPKTSGAALGTSLGVVIVGILQSIHAVHFSPLLYSAVPGFLGVFGAWLVPVPSRETPTLPPGPGN